MTQQRIDKHGNQWACNEWHSVVDLISKDAMPESNCLAAIYDSESENTRYIKTHISESNTVMLNRYCTNTQEYWHGAQLTPFESITHIMWPSNPNQ